MKLRSIAPVVAALLAFIPSSASGALAGAFGTPAGASGALITDGTALNGTVVAGPGGFVSPGTYATPVVTMTKGTQAVFYNGDIAPHDVVSIEKKGKKPLFGSKVIGLGQSAPVVRSEKLPAGDYVFYCTRHHWMQGRLVVI